jgi:hypothetical protein
MLKPAESAGVHHQAKPKPAVQSHRYREHTADNVPTAVLKVPWCNEDVRREQVASLRSAIQPISVMMAAMA